MKKRLVLVKGGGDLGSGVAHRLFRCGMHVVITELDEPRVIRRMVSFAQAVYDGVIEVEGVVSRKAMDLDDVEDILRQKEIPVMVDPDAQIAGDLRPDVIVDAKMAKKNLGTKITDAPIVIGLGPGFVAGVDVHAVIETNRGHNLGRVVYEGEAEKDTGIPGPIMGYREERVLKAPEDGTFRSNREIGDLVEEGGVVAWVDGSPIKSQISGVIRGLLQNGLWVRKGLKVGDINPRGVREHCFTISDKARAIGGGVLEAILSLGNKVSGPA